MLYHRSKGRAIRQEVMQLEAFSGKDLPPDRLVLNVLEEDHARLFPRG